MQENIWRKGDPHTPLVQHYGKQYGDSEKIKNRTTTWSSYSTSGYLPEKHKNPNLKRCMQPYICCTIIYNNQDMETTEVFDDGWVGK